MIYAVVEIKAGCPSIWPEKKRLSAERGKLMRSFRVIQGPEPSPAVHMTSTQQGEHFLFTQKTKKSWQSAIDAFTPARLLHELSGVRRLAQRVQKIPSMWPT